MGERVGSGVLKMVCKVRGVGSGEFCIYPGVIWIWVMSWVSGILGLVVEEVLPVSSWELCLWVGFRVKAWSHGASWLGQSLEPSYLHSVTASGQLLAYVSAPVAGMPVISNFFVLTGLQRASQLPIYPSLATPGSLHWHLAYELFSCCGNTNCMAVLLALY